ncbi:unnamed protein product [Blepharisma stoltei]|uniref:Protein-tyrosine-phosphatase n=1 Tax=Blepharisma stoltei TaxID=1481888 RepID=A0AAU9J717_9CILI|nr:unnamed protein product [Blepharisma stoltei]
MVDQYRIGRAFHTKIHQINDYLFIGSRSALDDAQLLQSLNIKKVLQLLDFEIPADDPSIEIHYIHLEDNPDSSIIEILPDCIKYIHDAVMSQTQILVHCNAGVSRSGAIVTAYIMASQLLSFDKALEYVQEKRACVDPNEGFTAQLRNCDPRDLALILL